MKGTWETREDTQMNGSKEDINSSLLLVEWTDFNIPIDFSRMIRSVEMNSELQHFPPFIIFKIANELILSWEEEYIDATLQEIKNILSTLKATELPRLTSLAETHNLIDKKIALQHAILVIFLIRAREAGFYEPDTSGISGIISSSIGFMSE